MVKKERMNLLNQRIIDKYNEEKIVTGFGNLNSPIVLVGEAPGAKEEETGKPFVGQAGKNFEDFLQVLNIRREDVYITNAVKYRPTKINPKTKRLSNRTPTIKEINDFREYIYEEINIVNPNMIVTLGNIPIRSICRENIKIGSIHGQVIDTEIQNKEYKVFPLYHPAAVIYRRELKDVYMSDLLNLKKEIKNFLKKA